MPCSTAQGWQLRLVRYLACSLRALRSAGDTTGRTKCSRSCSESRVANSASQCRSFPLNPSRLHCGREMCCGLRHHVRHCHHSLAAWQLPSLPSCWEVFIHSLIAVHLPSLLSCRTYTIPDVRSLLSCKIVVIIPLSATTPRKCS